MRREERRLEDLISVGPKMAEAFGLLGIRSVSQLAKQDPRKMFRSLERIYGEKENVCVLDVFCAAVAQAKNPRLPAERCQWWWWSRKRRKGDKGDKGEELKSKAF